VRTRFAAGLLLAGMAHGVAFAGTVTIQLRAAGPAPSAPLAAVVVLTPEGPGPAGAIGEPVELPGKVPGEVEVELRSDTTWRVKARLARYWSPERIVLPVAARATVVDLPLFPVGRLSALVAGPPDGRRPAAIAVRWRPSPGASTAAALPDATMVCPLQATSWLCEVPAGHLDLRLKAEGAIPLYRWGVEVHSGRTHDLGTVQLRRGSSVSGWVTTEAAGAPSLASRLELAPQSLGRPDGAGAERLRAMALETHSNERGFFQFVGVAPGSYVLRMAAPGYAPVRRAPIVVRDGLESELIEPLMLARPVSFEVVVRPPVDPYGRPWRLQLRSKDSGEDPAGTSLTGTASPEGRWARSGLAPGGYSLMVMGDFDSRWASQEAEIQRGQPPVDVEIPLVEIEGRVALGGEPLAATLWFGGRSGATRIRFDADVKGRFEGVLPRQGSWRVSLESATLKLSLKPVEVKVAAGQRRARIEIAVPDTRVAGEVVDEAGRKVSRAVVTAYDEGATHIESDESGEFEFRGLSPGTTGLEAEKNQSTSGVTEVVIAEKRESPPIRLVLRERTEARGRVATELRQGQGPPQDGRCASGVLAPYGELSLRTPETKAVQMGPPSP
jgi:hypothetical protein